jgi:hypothetical protein
MAIRIGRGLVVPEINQHRFRARRPLLWVWKQRRELALGDPTAAHHLQSGGLRVRQLLYQLPELSRVEAG